MPTLAKNEGRQLETGVRNISTSSVYAQPWWRGFESNCVPSPGEALNGSVTPGDAPSQGNSEGGTKDGEISADPHSEANGIGAQEDPHLKHLAASTAPMTGHLNTNSQMELVGHSIMLTTYPYADPQYGALMTYGAPVHPQLFGMPQTRVPLPIPMEEEPVYVNAKQYHGILRRRQSRAKAEMEKKVIKVRKPYLHESRHQHAMRRARGSGGRFLNTKKLESNGPNSASQEQTAGSTQSGNSSGSEHQTLDSNGNSDYRGGKGSLIQNTYEEHSSSKGNINSDRHPSPYYPISTAGEQARHNFNQESWNMLMMNHVPRGAASSN
ncbi:hypothetical protein M9H77_02337 [Catharanthus roseus]|uniref:Uncharacterized protein n=1 Tax=Catharanthus roseus TaxID=4058 RepID=A0ACC0C830_CATRO|nr:hypothetical protein M9H77_02337 [Catharanthus roseus]